MTDRIEFPYTDREGIYWDDLESYLNINYLKGCGCGRPQDNLKFIYDLLVIYKNFHESPHLDFKKKWEEYRNALQSHITDNWKQVAQFILYILDDLKIMEHGSSVPGWISDQTDFFALLERYMQEEYED